MTNEEIIQRGQLINDETEPAQNTSERVGGVIKGIGQNLADKDTAIAAQAARNGYYQCTVSGTTLAVTAPGFTLPAHGGNIRIKMSAPATGACTLNINGTGPKALLYNGAAVSSANTWEQNEIISVFYDPSGSGQYLASNSQGGGKFATGEKVKDIGIDKTPDVGSNNITESQCVYNNSIDVAMMRNGRHIPFTHGGYSGASTGTVYIDKSREDRIVVCIPVDNISKLAIAGGYKYACCLVGRGLPTSQYKTLHDALTNTEVDVAAAVQGTTGFTPTNIVVNIGNTNNTSLSDVDSVDDILKITPKESGIASLSVLSAITKRILRLVGDVTFTDNSITFHSGSILMWRNANTINTNNKRISFEEDTVFTLETAYYLVLRDEGLIVCDTGGLIETDVILLFRGSQGLSGGFLYQEYINRKNACNKLTDIPFWIGGYKGVLANYLEYNTTVARIGIELQTKNLKYIKIKDGYIAAGCLFEDSIPTSNFIPLRQSLTNESFYVEDLLKQSYQFEPNMIVLSIAKDIAKPDSYNFTGTESVEDIIEFAYASIPAATVEKKLSTVKIGILRNGIRFTNGQSAQVADVNLFRHTPRMIRIEDKIKIKTNVKLSGYVIYYDKDRNYLGYVAINTLVNNVILPTAYSHAKYIRISFNTADEGSVLPQQYILLESRWSDPEQIESFVGLPTDSGYENLSFPVRVPINVPVSDTSPSITQQYAQSSNYGVLHLPPTYTADGKPTPLIIYLHGQAERYTYTSVRFGSNVRYSPEWSAAGYAQMDVDMIPSVLNVTNPDAGLCDDAVCVEAAYKWVIEHYNVRRDGVYLFGRSRGGQAVFKILADYNPVKMPVICALSNAGANTILNYKLFRLPPTAAWWNAFCFETGLSYKNPPSINNKKIIPLQPTVVSFLRDNIDMWWRQTMTGLPMMVVNPTEYKTPLQIFNLLMSSYSASVNPSKDFIENFLEKCSFRSPVPLRFDWCVGDTQQPRYSPGTTDVDNYGIAGAFAFKNSIIGNSVYREWPSCTGGEPHYHEKFNLYDGDYTLPNGAVVTNPSMAQVEWLLWAQSHDNRDL